MKFRIVEKSPGWFVIESKYWGFPFWSNYRVIGAPPLFSLDEAERELKQIKARRKWVTKVYYPDSD